MKRIVFILFCCMCLMGCADSDNYLEEAMTLRQKLQNCQECSFDCVVTADYSDKVFSFLLHCTYVNDGTMRFTVMEPDSISNITGVIEGGKGKLTFDEQALLFPMLADGYISPVSAPWLMVKTLREGYIHSANETQDGACVLYHDSYEENPLQMECWFDADGIPTVGEILWMGRKILSLEVRNFFCV